MSDENRILKLFAGRNARLVPLVVVLQFVSLIYAKGAWSPLTGVKDGSDAAVEASAVYVGPQLSVRGGSLDFLHSATINGPVSLQELNNWGDPVVNVAGAFNVNGPSMNILDGAQLKVNGAAPGTVSVGSVTLNGGSHATIGALTATGGDVLIGGTGTSLHTTGNFQQTNGVFSIDAGADFQAGGTFTANVNAFNVRDGATFSVGNLTSGSVQTGTATINSGAHVTVNSFTATGGDVLISGTGTSLHTTGNYQQNNGVFNVDAGADFQAGGTFTANVNAFNVRDGATFSVGNLASGSIQTGSATISGGSHVTVNSFTATGGDVLISGTGTSLHTTGNFQQTNGVFSIDAGADFQAGGTFTANVNAFNVRDGGTFSVGNLTSGSVQTGTATINSGAHVTVNSFTGTGGDVLIGGTGTSLHTTGNYQQNNGVFNVDAGADFQAGGTFTANVNAFNVRDGATFSVGNLTSGSVQTGSATINSGAHVTVNSFTAGNNVFISGAGTLLQTIGNYQQSDGVLNVDNGVVSVGQAAGVSAGATINVGTTGTMNIGGGSPMGPGVVKVGPSGALIGSGTIVGNVVVDGSTSAASGNLIDAGLLLPGASTGVLTINGNLTQTSNGLLETEVGGLTAGSQHDKVVVAGSAALGGQLDVPIVNGYVPQAGDSVTILTAASVTGNFSAIFAPDLQAANPNLALAVVRSATDVKLQFVTPLTNIEFDPTTTIVDWASPGAWNTGAEPDSRNIVTVQNPVGVDERVDVQSNDAFVHELVTEGDSSHIMTLGIKNDRSLSVTTEVTVENHAIIALGDESTKGYLMSPKVVLKSGAVLKGNGGNAKTTQNDIRKLNAKRNVIANKNGAVRPGFSIGYLSVEGDYEQDAGGTLQMELTSASSYDKFIVMGNAALDGTLDVVLLDFIGQAGDSFDILDWETETGTFATINLPTLPSNLMWNVSRLYTDGMLQVLLAGDYNTDGSVNAADYTVWRKTLGQTGVGLAADGNGDHLITQLDYNIWRAHYGETAGSGFGSSGAVPEPAAFALVILGAASLFPATSRARLRRATLASIAFCS
jgi:hypothetical protein